MQQSHTGRCGRRRCGRRNRNWTSRLPTAVDALVARAGLVGDARLEGGVAARRAVPAAYKIGRKRSARKAVAGAQTVIEAPIVLVDETQLQVASGAGRSELPQSNMSGERKKG